MEPWNAPTSPDSAQPIWLRVLVAAGLLYAIAVFVDELRLELFHRVLAFDDSYMFIRYAKNFLAGDGPAWNPGDAPTYGLTSLLHFSVVTCVRGLASFSDAGVLRISSAIPSVAGIVLMAFIVAHFSRSSWLSGRPLRCAALIAPPLVGSVTYRANAFNGMETMLALTMNAALVGAALHARRVETRSAGFLLALAALLAFLARPDSGLYAIGLPLLIFGLKGPGLRSPVCFAFALGFVGLLAVDTAVKVWVFGDPLPLSFYAKSAGFYRDYVGSYQWNPATYLHQMLQLLLPFLLMLCFCVDRRSLRLLACFGLPLLLTFVYLGQVTQIMGFHARFYVPAVPFVIIPALLELDRRLSGDVENERWAFGATLFPRVLFAVLLMASGPAFDRASELVERHVLGGRSAPFAFEWNAQRSAPPLDWWFSVKALASLAEELPAGTTFALSEYGYVGARAPQVRLLDMVGLHTPEIAHHGFRAAALFEQRPDLISLPHPHYRRILSEILECERLWAEYDVYVSAFGFGLAVRREGEHRERVRDAFRAQWRRVYGDLDPELTRARRPAHRSEGPRPCGAVPASAGISIIGSWRLPAPT